MARIIAVASAKGGVGKTTTCINVAAALRIVTQTHVVVVDLDLPNANIADFLDLEYDEQTDPDIHDVLRGEISISDAIYEAPGDITVAPAGHSLGSYASTNPDRIQQMIKNLKREFDAVIMDTAAGISYESILPIAVADSVLLVTTPRLAAVRDTEKTKTLAERLDTAITGVVVVRTGSGTAPDPEKIAAYLNVDYLGRIDEDSQVPKAQDAGVPLVIHDLSHPVAKQYWDLAEQIPSIDQPTASDSNQGIYETDLIPK